VSERIIDECPGCAVRCEGPRDKVEQIAAWHQKQCSEYRAWEREQRARIALGAKEVEDER
jgi:hypothetical protein